MHGSMNIKLALCKSIDVHYYLKLFRWKYK